MHDRCYFSLSIKYGMIRTPRSGFFLLSLVISSVAFRTMISGRSCSNSPLSLLLFPFVFSGDSFGRWGCLVCEPPFLFSSNRVEEIDVLAESSPEPGSNPHSRILAVFSYVLLMLHRRSHPVTATKASPQGKAVPSLTCLAAMVRDITKNSSSGAEIFHHTY